MQTDAEIISQSKTDDPVAFEALVHRHGRAVHAFMARRAGHQVADELSSEVWLRAYRGRSGYDVRWVDARPWLYAIARNTLRSRWSSSLPLLGDLSGPPVDPWDRVDDRLDAKMRHSALASALREISEDDRDVLLLVAWEHLTPSEAATVLGIPQGTARSRLHRARTQLKRCLAAAPGATCTGSVQKGDRR